MSNLIGFQQHLLEQINDLTIKGEDDLYLRFQLNNTNYLVDCDNILYVMRNSFILPVPNAPIYIKGITEHNGSVYTCYDLKYLMINELQEITPRHKILILQQDFYQGISFLVENVLSIATKNDFKVIHEFDSESLIKKHLEYKSDNSEWNLIDFRNLNILK